MVLWLCRHGIMPLYTPLGGSWLNMAESIQRILKRRALNGQHPESPAQIGAWFEQTARAWNQKPTPFSPPAGRGGCPWVGAGVAALFGPANPCRASAVRSDVARARALPGAVRRGIGGAAAPPLGRKDPADVPAQRGLRLSAVLSGRDRAQPSVEARDAC